MSILASLITLFGLVMLVFGLIFIYEFITHWIRERKNRQEPGVRWRN